MGDGKVHFLYERGYHFRRMGDVSAEWTTFAEWTTVHSAEAVFDYHGPFSGRMGDFGRRMDDFPAEWTTFPAEWATIRRMGDATKNVPKFILKPPKQILLEFVTFMQALALVPR